MQNRDKQAERFYIEDHALLYALLVKHAQALAGQDGYSAMEETTAVYGLERGSRMARRCQADGYPLTMENYLVYGEWLDPKGWSEIVPTILAPTYINEYRRCGWNDTWKRYGLLEYGRLYCEIVDYKLVEGFNPALTLEMPGTLTHGGDCCTFHFIGAQFDSQQALHIFQQRRKQTAAYCTRDFLYHTAHLLSAAQRTLCTRLGEEQTQSICDAAFTEYTAIQGEEKRSILLKEVKQDFTVVG